MNERIKELKAQAMVCEDGINWILDEDRFAELLVRECSNVSENHKGMNDKYFIADAIKRHFEVKD